MWVAESLGKYYCGLAADWGGLLEHIDEARRTQYEVFARPADRGSVAPLVAELEGVRIYLTAVPIEFATTRSP